jgi:hypothetical protein
MEGNPLMDNITDLPVEHVYTGETLNHLHPLNHPLNHIIKPRSQHRHGWTEENTSIVTGWKAKIEEMSFIYSDAALRYGRKLQVVLVLSLLVGVIMTVLSALTLTLGPLGNQWVVLGINISLLGGSALISVMTGLVKVFSWDDKGKSYGDYSQQLFAFWTVLDSEMTLPPEHRMRASEFIKRKVNENAGLLQQGPTISAADYSISTHNYKNSIFNEAQWNAKYNKKMKSIMDLTV